MTTTPTNPLFDVLKGLKVVDSDTHWTEPPDLWTSRVPAKYKERVPRIKRVNGEDHWIVEDSIDYGRVGATVIDAEGVKVPGRPPLGTFEELSAAAYDPGARVKLMDRLGVWAQIVYPNAAGFSSAKVAQKLEDHKLRTLIVTVYNDAAAEFQQQSGGRLFPQAMLPVWDMAATVREVQRIKGMGLTGVTVADHPEVLGLPSYGEPYWEPFWEVCNALEVPLNFHIGASVLDANLVPWPIYGDRAKVAIASTVFYITNAGTLANFIYSGLFDRYPKLKLVSVESGIGWIPFVLECLEYQLDEFMPDTARRLQKRPWQYFRDHCFASFWFEDFGPRAMVEKIGAGNIMFETDFPHPTCLYPKSQEHIADVLKGLDPQVRKMILQDNAVQLYHLPVNIE